MPKSISLIVLSFFESNSRFSGLISLCAIPFAWQYATAFKTYSIIFAASDSLKFVLFVISSKSSPPVHNLKTMIKKMLFTQSQYNTVCYLHKIHRVLKYLDDPI